MGNHPLKRPPVFREDGTIEIHLTRGYVAIIDAVDAHLAKLNWFAHVNKKSGLVYATGKNSVALHLHILNLHTGLGPGKGPQGDHKDGDTLNCRRSNLRIVTPQVNARNRTRKKTNTSGYIGVERHKKRWRARLDKRHLGYFNTAEEANEARLEAECRKWGVEPRREVDHE